MRHFFDREFTLDFVFRIFFGVVITAILLYFVWLIRDALTPFFIGWLIAAVCMPVVRFFQEKARLKTRPLAVGATLISALLVFALLLALIVPPAIQEISKMGRLLEQLEARYINEPLMPEFAREWIVQLIDFNHLSEQFDTQQVIEHVKTIVPKVIEFTSATLSKLFSVFNLVLIFIYSVLIMLHYEEMRDGFYALLPRGWEKHTKRIINDLNSSTEAYFKGQTKIVGIVTVLHCIGFLLVGIPMAIPLGIITGLLNFIPYAQFLALIPTSLLCLLHAADTGTSFFQLFFLCLLTLGVIQIIQDMFITPRIMGEITGLNPAIILLSLAVGGTLFGVAGVVMALPLTPMVLTYYKIYVLKGLPERPIAPKKEPEELPKTEN